MRTFVMIGILGLFGLFGCADTTASNPPVAQAEPTVSAPATAAPAASAATAVPTAAPALTGGDANVAVIAALMAQLQGGPYRVTTVVDSADGPAEISGEIVPPDQYHTISVIGGAPMEMIIIGPDMWSKVDQAWVRSATPEGILELNTPAVIAESVSDATFVGLDTLNGVAVLVYTYTNTVGAGDQAMASANTLWVDAQSGLPLQVQGSTEFGGVEYMTTQTIVYDPSITIEAPQE